MIALKPSLHGLMFYKLTREDVKEYFAKIRKEKDDLKKAEQERLKKLENLRLAALNKNKKIDLGFGKKLSM
jgi:hypothetical protein